MSKAEEYLKSKKAFGMMFLRGILNQLDREKISMSRALELMNIQASDFSAQENKASEQIYNQDRELIKALKQENKELITIQKAIETIHDIFDKFITFDSEDDRSNFVIELADEFKKHLNNRS
jgi:hypothetical protein